MLFDFFGVRLTWQWVHIIYLLKHCSEFNSPSIRCNLNRLKDDDIVFNRRLSHRSGAGRVQAAVMHHLADACVEFRARL
jgi:hypothetical protein